jgi:hypothetical protein
MTAIIALIIGLALGFFIGAAIQQSDAPDCAACPHVAPPDAD